MIDLKARERQKRYLLRHREEVNRKKQEYWFQHKSEINARRKEKRHQLGISKKYREEMGISFTKEYRRSAGQKYRKLYPEKRRLYAQKRRHLLRSGTPLTLKTIQLVYEDNIKKYGTLTCEYCKKPIEFGKDTLDHKIPVSRKGTNNYENLCIACRGCNCRKFTKTAEEFIKISIPLG